MARKKASRAVAVWSCRKARWLEHGAGEGGCTIHHACGRLGKLLCSSLFASGSSIGLQTTCMHPFSKSLTGLGKERHRGQQVLIIGRAANKCPSLAGPSATAHFSSSLAFFFLFRWEKGKGGFGVFV